MNRRSSLLRSSFALLAILILAPLAAADEPLATLRINSLDTAMDDVEVVALALGTPIDQEGLTGQGLSPFGLTGGGWLNRSRPIAVALPMQGMTLGLKGLVGVFPVQEVAPAIDALKERYATHEADGNLHTFTREDGTTLAVRVEEGYLVASATPSMLRDFETAPLLSSAGLPPGNLTLDIQLAPLAPMMQAGLEQGRQMVKAQVVQKAQPAAETHGEDHAEDEGEGEHEIAEAPPAAAPFDPAQTDAMIDLYFDFLQDGIKNVSSVQISVEITGGHAVLHERFLPIPGSTLAGLLEAQSGGFPDIARLIPAEGGAVSFVSNIIPTPAFSDALKVYFGAYLDAIAGLLDSAGDDPLAGQLGQMLTELEPIIDGWIRCYRGDFAGSFALEPGGGMNVVEILGAADKQACEEVVVRTAELYAQLDAGAEGEKIFSMTENALSHGGVQAYRHETQMDAALKMSGQPENEETTQLMQALFGGGSLVGYNGLAGDLMLVTAGADSEQSFRDLVDRASKNRKKLEGGLTEEHFAPLRPGAGFVALLDMSSLVRWAAEALDTEDEDLDRLAALPPEAGRIVYGSRLDKQGLTFEFALPLEMLRMIRDLDQDEPQVTDERTES